MYLLPTQFANMFLATEAPSVVTSAPMVLNDASIITAAIALASAICYLYLRSAKASDDCIAHGKAQDERILILHNRMESILSELVRDSITTNREMKREMRRLGRRVESSAELPFPHAAEDGDSEDSTDRIIAFKPSPQDHG